MSTTVTNQRLPGRAVVVLGMHRSGTSCLAGSLQIAGLYSGDVNTSAPHNKKGNRELSAVMDLNDKILAANGGSWRDPPASVLWTSAAKHKGTALLRSLARPSTVWGFKDPRTLLTLDGWMQCLGEATLVATFRHPLAVIRSLHRRDQAVSHDEGLALWRVYNERLLEATSRWPVTLVEFGSPAERYTDAVIKMAQALGLPDAGRAGEFYEAAMRREAAIEDGTGLPGEIQAVLERLRALCV